MSKTIPSMPAPPHNKVTVPAIPNKLHKGIHNPASKQLVWKSSTRYSGKNVDEVTIK